MPASVSLPRHWLLYIIFLCLKTVLRSLKVNTPHTAEGCQPPTLSNILQTTHRDHRDSQIFVQPFISIQDIPSLAVWWHSFRYHDVGFCSRKKGVRTLLLFTTSFEWPLWSHRLAHILTCTEAFLWNIESHLPTQTLNSWQTPGCGQYNHWCGLWASPPTSTPSKDPGKLLTGSQFGCGESRQLLEVWPHHSVPHRNTCALNFPPGHTIQPPAHRVPYSPCLAPWLNI